MLINLSKASLNRYKNFIFLFLTIFLIISFISCSSFDKNLIYSSSISPLNENREMEYSIYTPPNWSFSEKLPLVVLLHGGGDSHDCFDRYGVSANLNKAYLKNKIPRVIFLIPNGELGFWEDWHDGSNKYRSWVIHELMPAVKKQYNTDENSTHVMGISMGAYGTLQFMIKEPLQFQSFTLLSGRVYNYIEVSKLSNNFFYKFILPSEEIFGPTKNLDNLKSRDPYIQLKKMEDSYKPKKIFLVYGSKEENNDIGKTTKRFKNFLQNQKIPNHLKVYPGGHDYKVWTPAIQDALKYIIK